MGSIKIIRKVLPILFFTLILSFIISPKVLASTGSDVSMVAMSENRRTEYHQFFAATKVDRSTTGIPKIKIEVLVANILKIFYFAIGVVSVMVIIIAGFTMVTSGHNPTSVAKARNAILFASIGIIITIGAFAMTQFIIGRF